MILKVHNKMFYVHTSLLNELRKYGNNSPDREVCGLITGVNEDFYSAEKFHKITNISHDEMNDYYIMDPQESFDVLKNTQIISLNPKYDLVAIFHTHPKYTPYPSLIDIKLAAYNVVYIIYSVSLNLFSFNYWNGNYFEPVNVEVSA